jgi:hypothetical protein
VELRWQLAIRETKVTLFTAPSSDALARGTPLSVALVRARPPEPTIVADALPCEPRRRRQGLRTPAAVPAQDGIRSTRAALTSGDRARYESVHAEGIA